MGREVKRVALDFNWPLEKVWSGYLNEHSDLSETCAHCEGSGSSAPARRLHSMWYGQIPFSPEERGSKPFQPEDEAILAEATRHSKNSPDFYGTSSEDVMREARRLSALFNTRWMHHLNEADIAALIEEGRLMDFTHTWTKDGGWVPREPQVTPTPTEVNVWSLSGMGHDSINACICVRAECKRLGLTLECSHCKGKGNHWPSPEAKEAYDKWERTEPPAGEGYQIWETVSEGSPITPVFDTAEGLANWCVKNRPWRSNSTWEQWMAFIDEGWAPSMVMTEGRMYVNEETAGILQ